MPNFMFIDYDSQTGRYLGHTYAPDRTDQNFGPNTNPRKLSIEETRAIGSEYAEYKYNEPELIKLPQACFVVSPPRIYEIGAHNKICVMLKRDSETPDNEYQQLLNNEYKVSINGQELNLKFEEMFFIDPNQSGIYTFEMIDPRIFVKVRSYTVTVIEASPQEI